MANTQETGISNTANIVYNGYDHKDVGSEYDKTTWGIKNTRHKYFYKGCFTYYNQIVVVGDDGIAKRIWKKIYNEGLLKKEAHFWLTNQFYLYYRGWPNGSAYASGFLFPDYKLFQADTMGPWLPSASSSGPEGTYSVKNSLIIGYRGYGYGSGNFTTSYTDANTGKGVTLDPKDAFCNFSVSPNGIDWYSTLKLKQYDRIGKKGIYVSGFIIVKGGFFYHYERVNENDRSDGSAWISYMSFDHETKEFGDPVDFNFSWQKLFNIPASTYWNPGYYCFSVDKYIFGYYTESINPQNTNYTYQQRIHFVRVSPEGEVRHFYTRWYYNISVNNYLTSDVNYGYLIIGSTNVYTYDGSCPHMTSVVGIDKDCNIKFFMSERNIYEYIGGYYQYNSWDGKLATILKNCSWVYKNDHSDWWYFYKRVNYSNKAFYKEGVAGDRLIIARSTDFTNFEIYECPDGILEYPSQTGTQTIKVTWQSRLVDEENKIYGLGMLGYNPEPTRLSEVSHICLKNGKISHSSGHFAYIDAVSIDYNYQGFIYIKNYACMRKEDDVFFIYFDDEYTYDQTLLNAFNGLDYPGKDT